MKRRYFIAAALASAIILTSCSFSPQKLKDHFSGEKDDISSQSTVSDHKDPPADAPKELEGGIRVEYSHLDGIEKNIYLDYLTAFSNGEFTVRFSSYGELDADMLYKVFSSVMWDHPELFNLSGDVTYRQITEGSDTYVDMECTEVLDGAKLDSMRRELNERVDEIVKKAEGLRSDHQKARLVHDEIILSCAYDHSAADRVLNNSSAGTEFVSAATAYGCLVEGKAICSGYTDAYQLIMQRLGIPCGKTAGSLGGISHIWNYIVLDGEYYYVDLTSDDFSKDGVEEKYPNLDYFCVSEERLRFSHGDIGSGEDHFVPRCDSMDKNPIVMSGAHFEYYDFDEVSDVIASLYEGEGYIELTFGDRGSCNDALEDLHDNGRLFDIPELSDVKSVSFITKESGIYLGIKFEN